MDTQKAQPLLSVHSPYLNVTDFPPEVSLSMRSENVITHEVLHPLTEPLDIGSWVLKTSLTSLSTADSINKIKPHSSEALRASKRASRLFRLAVECFEGHITSSDLLLNETTCSTYGLQIEDISLLKAQLNTRYALESVIEKKYGVIKIDDFRKRIIGLLKQNPHTQRTILEVDLVDLKGFNKMNPKFGDEALGALSGLFKTFLKIKGIENENIHLGRKGDEFYLDCGELDSLSVAQSFSQFIADNDNAMWLAYSEDPNCKKKANIYWKIAEVNVDNFDMQMQRLEQSIEEEKITSMEKFTQEINLYNDEEESKLALTLQYLIRKRVNPELLQAFILFNIKLFKSYFQVNQEGDETIVSTLMDIASSQKIVRMMDRLTTQLNQPQPHNLEDKIIKANEVL